MKIAVLGKGFYPTLEWIKAHLESHNEEIASVSLADAVVRCRSGKNYYIIQDKNDLNGKTFNGYLVAPTYEDLVSLIKERCEIGS